jgi:DtxR family transcriptional regulator, Mn-dependent transcriptional regulator
MTDALSTKMRAYLAEIYRLEDIEQAEDGYVSTSALADMLFVSPPAVNRMVNRLKEISLIEHEAYRGIKLTAEGQKLALKYLRAQRIAEVFLSKVMGFAWEEIYQEASRISSALSDAIIDRMAAMSDNPQYCPHGEPIPDADGVIEKMNDTRLSDIDTAATVKVTRMRTREADRLSYIQALGLMPGITLDVIHKAPFDGPMQLKIGKEYRIIGHNLAELIRVHIIEKA